MAMRFRALATDYDGTLATNGRVDRKIIAALTQLRASGRAVLLVTGRGLAELKLAFPHLDLFDRVVAENGALLNRPNTGEEKLLCAPVPSEFIARLHRLHIPVATGKAIVATSEIHGEKLRSVIRTMGLELQIIFNKGSAMVLPAGVDKESGLRHALAELSLAPQDVVAIGDAENDQTFLAACGCAVAVANALPEVKSCADLVTVGANGAGVCEVIHRLLAGDLGLLPGKPVRRR
jgi:hydroxymethylpyrimidine pyrophosphatase-like HAD family hydrolase